MQKYLPTWIKIKIGTVIEEESIAINRDWVSE